MASDGTDRHNEDRLKAELRTWANSRTFAANRQTAPKPSQLNQDEVPACSEFSFGVPPLGGLGHGFLRNWSAQRRPPKGGTPNPRLSEWEGERPCSPVGAKRDDSNTANRAFTVENEAYEASNEPDDVSFEANETAVEEDDSSSELTEASSE